jgi:hypothetical protein
MRGKKNSRQGEEVRKIEEGRGEIEREGNSRKERREREIAGR